MEDKASVCRQIKIDFISVRQSIGGILKILLFVVSFLVRLCHLLLLNSHSKPASRYNKEQNERKSSKELYLENLASWKNSPL